MSGSMSGRVNAIDTYKEQGIWGKCNITPGQSFTVCPFYESNDTKWQTHCFFLKEGFKCVNQLLYPDSKITLPEELFEL